MNKKLLFLCTGNSCRSQMAEGFSSNKSNHHYNIFSAGVEAHGLNSKAIRVMGELGIDISNQQSKSISEDELSQYDIIITLCGDAKDRCPILSEQTNHTHWDLEDPAKARGTEREILDTYRKVRDQIRDKINLLL